MSLKYKYRIIGVVILLIALVTLLPSFFQKRDLAEQQNFVAIPTIPSKVTEQEFNQSELHNAKTSKGSDNSAAIVNDAADSKNQIGANGVGYVIQLGSFMQLHNIDEIKAKLSLLNYRVYTIPSEPKAGKMTRVLVGPYPTEFQAQAALQSLKSSTNLSGSLVKFDPLQD